MAEIEVLHSVGRSLSLTSDGKRIFTLDYSSAPKPFIHPLATTGGHVLTNFQPSDHYWHRGLWFAIKFVNGENFWEEGDTGPHNTQRTVLPPTIEPTDDGSVKIVLHLEWTRHDGHVVMDEVRTIAFRSIDATTYTFDHESKITPREAVTLDRTPFTTWGGYGGLCLRGTRNWTESKIHLSDGTATDRPTGIPGDWAMLTGKLDGDRGLHATVAMLEHPGNDRRPTPWYGASGIGLYLTPAPFFHAPLELASGRVLRLAYRLIVAERVLEAEEVQRAYDDYVRSAH